ncbi:MAG: right-handed parallel beta-helix repeat-containing protein, partial [Ignavibacteriaceae bacterium]|nr:right-handed parallel beta-helix repeat-containing protein [Ignavibacteriaceae bacterium]
MHNRNNKYHQTLFLILFFLLIAYSLLLNATIRYVSKTGLSIPPYTTWETAADSIQKCINISVFGDTIYVANGIYEERVVMIPGLALIGSGTDSCIVDSRVFPPMGNRTITMADSCLIKGFYILTSNDFNYGYGIYATGQNGLITMNKFSNSNSGVVLWVSDTKVYKNYFFNVRTGVYVSNSNSTIRKNEIYTITDQIGSAIIITGFSDDYHPIIDSNYIATRTDGIRKSLGTRPIIRNNIIEFVQYGGNAIDVSYSDSAYIYNNLIIMGTGIRGIYNYNVPYLQVMNNYIQGSSIMSPEGMLVGGSNTVKNNVVVNTVTGISGGGIQNLLVQYNNLWNNDVNYS